MEILNRRARFVPRGLRSPPVAAAPEAVQEKGHLRLRPKKVLSATDYEFYMAHTAPIDPVTGGDASGQLAAQGVDLETPAALNAEEFAAFGDAPGTPRGSSPLAEFADAFSELAVRGRSQRDGSARPSSGLRTAGLLSRRGKYAPALEPGERRAEEIRLFVVRPAVYLAWACARIVGAYRKLEGLLFVRRGNLFPEEAGDVSSSRLVPVADEKGRLLDRVEYFISKMGLVVHFAANAELAGSPGAAPETDAGSSEDAAGAADAARVRLRQEGDAVFVALVGWLEEVLERVRRVLREETPVTPNEALLAAEYEKLREQQSLLSDPLTGFGFPETAGGRLLSSRAGRLDRAAPGDEPAPLPDRRAKNGSLHAVETASDCTGQLAEALAGRRYAPLRRLVGLIGGDTVPGPNYFVPAYRDIVRQASQAARRPPGSEQEQLMSDELLHVLEHSTEFLMFCAAEGSLELVRAFEELRRNVLDGSRGAEDVELFAAGGRRWALDLKEAARTHRRYISWRLRFDPQLDYFSAAFGRGAAGLSRARDEILPAAAGYYEAAVLQLLELARRLPAVAREERARAMGPTLEGFTLGGSRLG